MDLNNDLITEILLHLPVQSLLRFRSVCKCWCDIINSSTFTESHLHNQSQNYSGENLFLQIPRYNIQLGLSILNADNGKSYRGFPALDKLFNNGIENGFLYDVTGSVNGLICIYNQIIFSADGSTTIAICNPCLDKIKILPVSPICSWIDYESVYRQDYSRGIGFCFDSVTKDYEVVQLVSFTYGHMPTSAEVYSGKSNTWRKLITDNTLDDHLCNIERIKSSAYTKSGSLAHWQIERWIGGRLAYAILSFNVHNEVFETIPYPNLNLEGRMLVDTFDPMVFAKDDDSFSYFVFACNHQTLEVWDLKRTSNEQCWRHVTDVSVVPSIPRYMWPGALWKGVGVVLMKYCLEGKKLILYDYHKENVWKSFKMPKIKMEILEYKGSLIRFWVFVLLLKMQLYIIRCDTEITSSLSCLLPL